MKPIVAKGPDGSEFIGFLASLGAFAALSRCWPSSRLSWTYHDLGWRPCFHVAGPEVDVAGDEDIRDAIVRAVECGLRDSRFWSELSNKLPQHTKKECSSCHGLNFELKTEDFRGLQEDFRTELGVLVAERAEDDKNAQRRGARGSRGGRHQDENVLLTPLINLTGGSHQHFLTTVENLLGVGTEDLRRVLFEPWDYDDKEKALTLRLDPLDDRSHAYGSGDPSDTKKHPTLAQKGANRLALEAFRLFPLFPAVGGFSTPAYRPRANGPELGEFVWPLWSRPISLAAISSVLSLSYLFEDPPPYSKMRAMGITAVFRARRYKREKGYYISRGSPRWEDEGASMLGPA